MEWAPVASLADDVALLGMRWNKKREDKKKKQQSFDKGFKKTAGKLLGSKTNGRKKVCRD